MRQHEFVDRWGIFVFVWSTWHHIDIYQVSHENNFNCYTLRSASSPASAVISAPPQMERCSDKPLCLRKASPLQDQTLALAASRVSPDLWPLLLSSSQRPKWGSFLRPGITKSRCLHRCLLCSCNAWDVLSDLQKKKEKKKKTFISTRWNRTNLDGGTLTPLFLCDVAIRM